MLPQSCRNFELAGPACVTGLHCINWLFGVNWLFGQAIWPRPANGWALKFKGLSELNGVSGNKKTPERMLRRFEVIG